MNTVEFLSYLRSLNVQLDVESEKVRISAPSGVLTLSLKNELFQRKGEILEFLSDRITGTPEAMQMPQIVPISRDKSLPLSFAQQRLWFLNQLEPGSVAYSLPVMIQFRGALDIKALKQAFHEIARRHETLRTTFRETLGRVQQVIASEPSFSLKVIDLCQFTEDNREKEMRRLMDIDSKQPFDLNEGPLFRLSLYRTADQNHVLHINMHHMISDYWSFGVISREFVAFYTALVSGTPPQLPELPVQYADFAYCQREWLQKKVPEAYLTYWKEKLGGELTTLDLPADRPRPKVQTHHGATHSLEIPKSQVKKLRTLSRAKGVTLFMILLAAFKTLLYRYSGQEDIIVGTSIAGRNRAELERLIGFFINTIVMRTDLSGNPGFNELIHRVRETALGAYAHQEMPFDKLVEELAPERDLSRTPIFQVFFNHIRMNEVHYKLPGVEAEVVGVLESESKFDMTLYVFEGDNEITLTTLYNSDLFDGWRIAEMLKQYETLLEQIVENPDEKIAHYSLVTPWARQILPDPRAVLDEPLQTSVTDMFANWVKRTPEEPALIKGDQALSYEELSQSARKLAIILQLNGLTRGDTVAVHGARSFGLITSMLAVLLSGGVLLSVDENLPRQRQKLILQEAGARMMLYIRSSGLEDAWWENDPNLDVQSIEVDTIGFVRAFTDVGPEAVSLPELSVDDPAYIFFTSGTTGIPKGVLGSHKGLSHFLNWQRETFGIEPEDRVAHLTSLSFDPVLREIFLPLTSGATLCLPEEIDILDANDVLSWLERERISVLHTVPSLAQNWLNNATVEVTLSAMRWLFFAGEALTENLVRRCHYAYPNTKIVNLYGPTETTLAKCFYEVPSDVHHGVQPIGRPLPQTQALVLSRGNQLCGIGEAGEIVLRTPFRSLGYINADEENRKRFLRNPFRADEMDCVYFTGDRGRYRSDGMIEFLGRLDDQIKIRGVRVEPNEVAAMLAGHPVVESCFVTGKKNEQGRIFLVAYVVVAEQSRGSVSELRAYLSQRLPATMIPEIFVFLGALPLTSRGKIDRRALPAPDQLRPDLEEAFVAPRTPSEELVAGIWSNILGIERIGIHDGFFDLGGHSLSATQVVSRIRKAFQVELPLRTLFEAPTVAGLTEHVEAACKTRKGFELPPPFDRVSRDTDLPLSFSQQRVWFLDQLEPGTSAYNISHAARLTGSLDVEALERSFNEILKRHESLRTTFGASDGQAFQSIHPPEFLALSIVDLQEIPETQRLMKAQKLAMEEANRSFDLSKGPLIRMSLLRIEDTDHILLLTIHHIVADGWSIGVFIHELGVLYKSFTIGQPSPLPPLEIQYADFACWQRKWLQGEALEAQVAYWKQKLHGIQKVLNLPTDRRRPQIQSFRGARQRLQLTLELSNALKTLSKQEGTTLFTTLLAAFNTLLYRYSVQEDICIGTYIANRNRSEIERLIGFFVNTLVMRTDISGNPSFRELLGRIHKVTFDAYAHQDLPFEKLLEILQPERDMSHTPLFQVMFVLQNMPIPTLELPDLTLHPLSFEHRRANFDLTLWMYEVSGRLVGSMEYSRDLFDDATISRMIDHFQILLESIIADPDQSISVLPILPKKERHQLLVGWNDTAADYPQDKCIHELFEAQVKRTPNAVALVFEDRQMTYQELNQCANQLAHYLQALGVGPEVLVGICIERSIKMIVGLMGILKAGGAYVPLDPTYPPERLAFMLEDARVSLVLTEQRLIENLSKNKLNTVCLDTDWEAITQQSLDNPTSEVMAENLAYIIFTSGSTGRPKGVMIEHGSLVNYTNIASDEFGISPQDRVLQFASINFDASAEEIYPCLTRGATLVLRDDSMLGSSSLFLQKCQEGRLTVLDLPTAYWHELTDELSSGTLTLPERLRLVIIGGERALPERLKIWREQVGERIRLLNTYGPTEATIVSTMCDLTVSVESDDSVKEVPIGKPVSNVQAYVLDQNLQPVPIGVPGELHIGGLGLARGYLDQPELTATKFIQSPYEENQNTRLYKTGDLVRYLPDGNMEFLGRIDDQVKVRGFRIELGEIETALNQHMDVRESVIKIFQDGQGQNRLAAYFVVNGNAAPSIREVRDFLKQSLPEYMIPSTFVSMKALPLTPNGKVDRKALPEPESFVLDQEANYEEPRTDLERTVAAIWQEVLNLEKVGVHNNFFELGGHSLKVTRVLSRLRATLNIDLPLVSLFQAATVAAQAELIEKIFWTEKSQQVSSRELSVESEYFEL